MKRLFSAVFGALIFVLAVSPHPALGEPLAIKNHSPVWFGLLFPTSDAASAAQRGEWKSRLDTDYSNIYFIGKENGWQYAFDMELAQVSLDVRYGIADGLEAGMEQPFFHMGGGFLDSPVMAYHNVFGFPAYNGELEAPRNHFLYQIVHGTREWNGASPHTVFNGDTALWLKQEIYRGDGSAASAKLLAQVPTASTTVGMGNGAWEWGVMAMVDQALEMWEISAATGYFNPVAINRGEGYALNGYYYWEAALVRSLPGRCSVIAQLTNATSPYASDTPELFRRQWQALTIGFRHIMESGKKIEISLTEDLSFSAPDFTIHAGVEF